MTEICAFDRTRVLSIPGQAWTQDPPAEVKRLRSRVLIELAQLDALLRAESPAVMPLEPLPPLPFAVGGVAYC